MGKGIIIAALVFIGCLGGMNEKREYKICAYGFDAREFLTIYAAAGMWEVSGAVKFNFVSAGDEEYQIVKNETVGGATMPGRKMIVIGEVTPRIVCHELGHLLGLGHEHQRLDRDNYITVNMEYVAGLGALYLQQFEKINREVTMPYDYMSVMHYREDDLPGSIDFHGHEAGGNVPSVFDMMKVIEKNKK